MTAPVVFTSSYSDNSNDNGFQWEFHCDRCNTAYRSPFEQNYLSRGRGVLRVLRDLFGDYSKTIHKVSNAADDFSNTWSGGAASATKDKAFTKAVDLVKDDFRLCAGCGSWVCARICWNDHVGQCTRCSPMAAHQLAQAQAEARGSQFRDAANQQDWTQNQDMSVPSRVTCPTCAANTTGGRFCGSCGTALDLRTNCTGCGHQIQAGTAFCSNCGRAQ
ncbi:zinc ribbon domain-containing protein [Nocardia sp. SYP-A9097]|uniref:zinc ribbon domain-containing protein n=1 Tax=Nocardia sp. SYP-A9097 TaxID=2663237 RepID=UPI001891A2FF|nr:zinc ribbon domain-containing protein [Nocardia sp. SYP-A9097]